MKRAQASLEFLTTYGWAFMVIMVMIGALSYYGITNPTMFIPERCAFSTEISCEDFQVIFYNDVGNEKSIIHLYLRQTLGKTIYLRGLDCYDTDNDIADSFGYVHNNPNDIVGGEVLPTADTALEQWDPPNPKYLTCELESNPFVDRVGDRVRVPLTLTIWKQNPVGFDGFDHEIQGEIVGVVQEMTP